MTIDPPLLPEITFQSPWWLWALLAVPVLVVLYVLFRRDGRRAAARWAEPGVMAAPIGSAPSAWRGAASAMALLAIVASIVGLARPSMVATEQEQRSTVMLAMDISTSMLRTDLQPTRLAAAVDTARRFVEEAPEDTALGLVSFADGARVVVAPTRDRARMVEALNGLEAVNGGTALGEAVVTSLGALRASGAITEQGERDPARSAGRVLIMTDGVNEFDTAVTPNEAADRAAAEGVPLYPILLGNDPGREGQATPAETLSGMATRTGGIFGQSVSTADLQAIFADIGSIVAPVERLRELTIWCVAIAALALTLAAAFLALSRPRPSRAHEGAHSGVR